MRLFAASDIILFSNNQYILMTAAFPSLILASNSQRRQVLLRQIHVNFDVSILPDHLDIEKKIHRHRNESPEDYAIRLSVAKNRAARTFLSTVSPILTADTIVTLDDQILGKPDSVDTARKMLARLSGKRHHVVTAVTLSLDNQTMQSCTSTTDVTFAHLTDAAIERYLSIDNVMDKAGSYAIQEFAALFIQRIEGSYSNVVGLPLFETGQLLVALDLLPITEQDIQPA